MLPGEDGSPGNDGHPGPDFQLDGYSNGGEVGSAPIQRKMVLPCLTLTGRV